MVTVLNSVGNRFFVLSKVRLTSASPLGPLLLEPLKTRLSRFSLLRLLILCSPITQRMESTILLFPHPLGPIIPVIPSSKFTTVLSAKLLKPLISKLFNLTFLWFGQATNISLGGMGLSTSCQQSCSQGQLKWWILNPYWNCGRATKGKKYAECRF